MVDYTFGLGSALGSVWGELGTLTERALDRHLRVAVTGLRRSGKTVLTTCLVHQLRDGHDLPFLKAVHDGRYLGAAVRPAAAGEHAFPFASFEAGLRANPPHWPQATERLSTLDLEIAWRTTSLILRQVAPIQHLTVEIVDYPGEWLLDLPLLAKSYEEFSADSLALAATPLRASAAERWHAALAAFDPDAAAEPPAIAALAQAWTAYLEGCHTLGLAMVQPGRFTNPGDLAGRPVLDFAPLPPGETRPGSNRALMAERYLAYRERVVRPFYEDEFSRFDRQIVLVDLLSCLNAGPGHFDDTAQALATVLESFRYGETGLLGRLFAPRIDRLLFAASKADHVAHNQHANLKQLLELMITPAARAARRAGIAVEVLALSALRATDVVRTEHQGQMLSCVRGRLVDEARETVLFPGEIPPHLPEPEDWASGRFRFRAFAPRRLVAGTRGQHIRLDQALEFLIGDKLG